MGGGAQCHTGRPSVIVAESEESSGARNMGKMHAGGQHACVQSTQASSQGRGRGFESDGRSLAMVVLKKYERRRARAAVRAAGRPEGSCSKQEGHTRQLEQDRGSVGQSQGLGLCTCRYEAQHACDMGQVVRLAAHGDDLRAGHSGLRAAGTGARPQRQMRVR